MTAEVVDGVERHSPGRRVRLGGSHSDQQRTGQAGPMVARRMSGCRFRRWPAPGAMVGPSASRVCARGDLGHHAAVAGVLVDAGGHLVGQQCKRLPSPFSRAMPTPVSSQELSMARMVVIARPVAWCRHPPRWPGSSGLRTPIFSKPRLSYRRSPAPCRCALRGRPPSRGRSVEEIVHHPPTMPLP